MDAHRGLALVLYAAAGWPEAAHCGKMARPRVCMDVAVVVVLVLALVAPQDAVVGAKKLVRAGSGLRPLRSP